MHPPRDHQFIFERRDPLLRHEIFAVLDLRAQRSQRLVILAGRTSLIRPPGI